VLKNPFRAVTPKLSIDEIRENFDEILHACGLRAKLLHIDLDWNNGPRPLVLDRLVIRNEERGQRIANQVMKAFIAFCDNYKLSAELTVRPLDESTDEVGLRRLYSRYGFVTAENNKMMRSPTL
jgi:predicted GNAT family N-acyltransferase